MLWVELLRGAVAPLVKRFNLFPLTVSLLFHRLTLPTVDATMAHTGAMEDASADDSLAKQGTGVCLRSRPCSSERDGHVRAVKAALQSRLGPYEPVLTYLQSVLVWERPVQCVLLYIVVNIVFWWVEPCTFWRQTCPVASVCFSVVATHMKTIQRLSDRCEEANVTASSWCFYIILMVSPVNSRQRRWLASGTINRHAHPSDRHVSALMLLPSKLFS